MWVVAGDVLRVNNFLPAAPTGLYIRVTTAWYTSASTHIMVHCVQFVTALVVYHWYPQHNSGVVHGYFDFLHHFTIHLKCSLPDANHSGIETARLWILQRGSHNRITTGDSAHFRSLVFNSRNRLHKQIYLQNKTFSGHRCN